MDTREAAAVGLDEESPTIRIYVRHGALETATVQPPAGSLAGWVGYDIDESLWEEYSYAKSTVDVAAARATDIAAGLVDLSDKVAEAIR